MIAAYTSIRDVAKSMVGSLLSVAVPNILRTSEHITKINCPMLFLHGE